MRDKKKLLNAAPEAWAEMSPAPWTAWVEGYWYHDPKTGEEKLAWGGSPVVLDAEGRNIAEPDRSHRDAFVMAAAPELLEALKQEHRRHRTSVAEVSGLDKIEGCEVCALIGRAEGRGFREYETGAGNAISEGK